METVILKIERDIEGLLTLNIDDEVAWEIADEFRNQILNELQRHLGAEQSEEFDPMIHEAIRKIRLSIDSSKLDEDSIHRPPVLRLVKKKE